MTRPNVVPVTCPACGRTVKAVRDWSAPSHWRLPSHLRTDPGPHPRTGRGLGRWYSDPDFCPGSRTEVKV